jgi:hypothetical protein
LWLCNLLLSKQQPEQVFTQNQDVLLNQQVKFKNWYMLVLSQYHKFESYKINIYSVVSFIGINALWQLLQTARKKYLLLCTVQGKQKSYYLLFWDKSVC